GVVWRNWRLGCKPNFPISKCGRAAARRTRSGGCEHAAVDSMLATGPAGLSNPRRDGVGAQMVPFHVPVRVARRVRVGGSRKRRPKIEARHRARLTEFPQPALG